MIYQGIHNLAPTEKQQKYYLSAMNNKPDNTDSDGVKKTQELTQKIALLKKQLAWGKLRSAALDTMINIPEKQADISFRKKSGTQQSG